MTSKEKAIESLEGVAHWMRKSSFDYELAHLALLLNEVKEDYKKYLEEK
jgi:hypothetical protein